MANQANRQPDFVEDEVNLKSRTDDDLPVSEINDSCSKGDKEPNTVTAKKLERPSSCSSEWFLLNLEENAEVKTKLLRRMNIAKFEGNDMPSRKEPPSIAEVVVYLIDLRSDFCFKIRLGSSSLIPIGDTISDILLTIEWLSQGHFKWTVALISAISLNTMVTTLGPWASKLDTRSLRKRIIRLPLYLFGFGPSLEVPETVKHRGTKLEEYHYYCFLFAKILEVICEATPSLLVTSYATVIALCTDKRAPDVTPFTGISLSFSMITISLGWAALSVFEREVSFVRQLFMLFVNCCEIYGSLMTPALIVAFFKLECRVDVFGIFRDNGFHLYD